MLQFENSSNFEVQLALLSRELDLGLPLPDWFVQGFWQYLRAHAQKQLAPELSLLQLRRSLPSRLRLPSRSLQRYAPRTPRQVVDQSLVAWLDQEMNKQPRE